MQFAPDASTVDLTRTCLRICDGVRFQPQFYGEQTFYHIEIPARSQFYRIGYTEYVFVSLLDGQTTFSEALALTARSEGASALGQEQAMSLFTWLLENKVAQIADEGAATNKSQNNQNKAAEVLQKLNPFWIRIPFGRPESFLKSLHPLVGWMFTPAATILGFALMLAAGVQLASEWNQFSTAANSVFAQDNWVWLFVAWIGLKFIHEMAHGMACQRYGGEVRETGVILAFFAPLAYVDVTSCWSFSSRWKRIHVAAAGMYAELILASVSVFLWTRVDSLILSHLLYNVIVMASISTLLFNANPLMKFDGYYILSDLLQLPNLYTQASEAIRSFSARWIWGTHKSEPSAFGRQAWVLRAYGAGAVCWKLLICFSMLIAASVLFHGAGIVLAIAGSIAWFGMPLFQFGKMIKNLAKHNPARLLRGGVVLTGLTSLLLAVTLKVPVPFSRVAPGVVEMQDGRQVRCEVDGFIDQIYVSDGQLVNAGDVLLRIRNDDVTSKHSDLLIQIEQENIRYQIAMKMHESGEAVVARKNLESLHDRLSETRRDLEALDVIAPASGQVVARQLHSRLQTYVSEGDELVIVDDNQPKQIRVSVAQEDFALAGKLLQNEVDVRIGTRPLQRGVFEKVIPRASRQLFSEALAATEGGSLPVTAMQSGDDDSQSLELTSPRFEAIVLLDAHISKQLVIGERGYVALGNNDDSIGVHFYRTGRKWLKTQIEVAQQASAQSRL